LTSDDAATAVDGGTAVDFRSPDGLHLRGTLVTPAAAARSAGVTTAMT